MSYQIPFIKPSFPRASDIAEDVEEIIQSNRFTNFGPKEQQFVCELEGYLGQSLRVATFANGTLALLAAVHSILGKSKSGRYVITPSFTFAAVPQAAIWNGFHPWFIDIDPVSFQASPESARDVIEKRREEIAAIILPNAKGIGTPHIDAWEQLASQWKLPLVIDSAAGFGSTYEDGLRLGGRGNCEIFSFHATKPFAIGEGGALASHDEELVARVHDFQNFGLNAERLCHQMGINGKLSEINAAIGLRQLVNFDARLASRRATFEHYCAELSDFGVAFPPNAERSTHPYASIYTQSGRQKKAILETLARHGIEGRDYYNPPLHLHPYFLGKPQRSASTDLSVTEEVCAKIVSLPIHENMAPQDIDRVVYAVKQGIAGA